MPCYKMEKDYTLKKYFEAHIALENVTRFVLALKCYTDSNMKPILER